MDLNGQHLTRYLTGYGIDPPPVGGNPVAAHHLGKEILKQLVGVLVPV